MTVICPRCRYPLFPLWVHHIWTHWVWYWPWHVIWHKWLGHQNGYSSGFRLFCMWCAGNRLRAWLAAER